MGGRGSSSRNSGTLYFVENNGTRGSRSVQLDLNNFVDSLRTISGSGNNRQRALDAAPEGQKLTLFGTTLTKSSGKWLLPDKEEVSMLNIMSALRT